VGRDGKGREALSCEALVVLIIKRGALCEHPPHDLSRELGSLDGWDPTLGEDMKGRLAFPASQGRIGAHSEEGLAYHQIACAVDMQNTTHHPPPTAAAAAAAAATTTIRSEETKDNNRASSSSNEGHQAACAPGGIVEGRPSSDVAGASESLCGRRFLEDALDNWKFALQTGAPQLCCC